MLPSSTKSQASRFLKKTTMAETRRVYLGKAKTGNGENLK
jgi:hypothetical protein